jgi:cytochrome P450
VLLDVPESEADRFISWGVHVFHGPHGVEQAAELERYLNEQFDRAAAAPGDRASLCWASANLDETVFEAADEVRLDRRPNPHVSFGFGVHLCLGAAHSRTVMRVLLTLLCRRVRRIELVSKRDRVEHTAAYDRQLGYDSLVVRLLG